MEYDHHLHVFAYGSNLCTQRMRDRVPSAQPVATGYVNHRQLAFHKRSEDGSAKANAVLTSCPTDRVWGVVYRLLRIEKPALDRHEFLGVGYDNEEVNVVLGKGFLAAWIYVARSDAIDPALLPYSWYLDYLIHGAHEHQLPNWHIDYLMNVQSKVDSDASRQKANRRIIDG